jgi:prepilin-type processing-associated H-X9-DG protein
MFSDSALIATWMSPPILEESYSIAAPLVTYGDAPVPATHFRHDGRVANVAFVDGHVETRTEDPSAPAPSGWSAAAMQLKQTAGIGYLSGSVAPYTGRIE